MAGNMVCLECGAKNVLEENDLIYHADVPLEKDDALTLASLVPLCKRCGAPMYGIARALYVDTKKQFAVRYQPPWLNPIPFTEDPQYILRETDAPLPFREKILLLDNGIDDVVIEVLKMVTRNANPDIQFDAIYCGDVTPDHFEMRALCTNSEDFLYNIPRQGYEDLLAQIHAASDDSWRPQGFSFVDSIWVKEKMSKLR